MPGWFPRIISRRRIGLPGCCNKQAVQSGDCIKVQRFSEKKGFFCRNIDIGTRIQRGFPESFTEHSHRNPCDRQAVFSLLPLALERAWLFNPLQRKSLAGRDAFQSFWLNLHLPAGSVALPHAAIHVKSTRQHQRTTTMKIIYNRFIPFGQYLGINLFGILFVRKEYEADMKSNIQMRKEVINHEQIHTAQMQELWYIPFYLIYIFWHIKLLFKTRNNTEAYRQNPFELEAYANDHNLNYLQTRKRFAFRRYI